MKLDFIVSRYGIFYIMNVNKTNLFENTFFSFVEEHVSRHSLRTLPKHVSSVLLLSRYKSPKSQVSHPYEEHDTDWDSSGNEYVFRISI